MPRVSSVVSSDSADAVHQWYAQTGAQTSTAAQENVGKSPTPNIHSIASYAL